MRMLAFASVKVSWSGMPRRGEAKMLEFVTMVSGDASAKQKYVLEVCGVALVFVMPCKTPWTR